MVVATKNIQGIPALRMLFLYVVYQELWNFFRSQVIPDLNI